MNTGTTESTAAATTTPHSAPEITAKTRPAAIPPEEKCKAVLALWTETESMSAVCRRLAIARPQLIRWEDLALAGMLKALEEPRAGNHRTDEPVLSRRLTKLLEKRLPRRLEQLAALETKVAKAVRKRRPEAMAPDPGK